jgi:hypothetical protein
MGFILGGGLARRLVYPPVPERMANEFAGPVTRF